MSGVRNAIYGFEPIVLGWQLKRENVGDAFSESVFLCAHFLCWLNSFSMAHSNRQPLQESQHAALGKLQRRVDRRKRQAAEPPRDCDGKLPNDI
jgi:hypothetical protein